MTSPSSPPPPVDPAHLRSTVPPQGPAPVPAQGQPGPWAGQPTGWVPPPPPPGARSFIPVPLAPNGQPLASFGDRLLAFLLDGLIAGAFAMIFTIPLGVIWVITVSSWAEDQSNAAYGDPYYQPDAAEFFGVFGMMMIFFVGIFAVNLLVTYLYLVEYQLRKGGETVGKRVLKLRVVKVVPGQVLTRGDLAKRWGVERVAGMFVPGLSYLDGLWQLWDKPLQQCLHDKAAQTVVVKVG
ncbi:RDD family protein [Catellatospora methionotrophica]|uniref:RDD family protein n=1 Tax=Catellatospora methionotrophica TaxID=121620 RepID=UPI003408C6D4